MRKGHDPYLLSRALFASDGGLRCSPSRGKGIVLSQDTQSLQNHALPTMASNVRPAYTCVSTSSNWVEDANVYCNRVTSSKLRQRLLRGIKGCAIIDIWMRRLSEQNWQHTYNGPASLLDVSWLLSLCSRKALQPFVYRVACDGKEREEVWLTCPESPKIVDTSARSVAVAFCGISKFTAEHCSLLVEVCEGPTWQPMRVNLQEASEGNFVTLPLFDSRSFGGVLVTDLKPATWYRIRLRVDYDGSQTIGPSIVVATRCCRPDAPSPPPSVEDHDSSFRVTWKMPAHNGYPIQYFLLEQRERVTARESVPPLFGTQADAIQWTPWRHVRLGRVPNCVVRAPKKDPAAYASARQVLDDAAPRFLAVEFRIAATNALGRSAASHSTRATKFSHPRAFASASKIKGSCRVQQSTSQPVNHGGDALSATDNFVQDIVRKFDFPVAVEVVKRALRETQREAAAVAAKQKRNQASLKRATMPIYRGSPSHLPSSHKHVGARPKKPRPIPSVTVTQRDPSYIFLPAHRQLEVALLHQLEHVRT